MQNKIIIPLPNANRMRSDGCGLVKVTPEAEAILRRMCRETGVPMRRIASSIIEQAAEWVEFVSPEDER